MDKAIWIVAGHKGGTGKSMLAMCMVDWLVDQGLSIAVVDGDAVTRDVGKLYKGQHPTAEFDFDTDAGWDAYADFLCSGNLTGHFVSNTRNSLANQTLASLERFCEITKTYGFTVHILYIVPTTADPHFAAAQAKIGAVVVPIKNLVGGLRPSDFAGFDAAHGPQHLEILLPHLRRDLVRLVQMSSLTFRAFTLQSDDSPTNCVVPKAEVAEWRDHMLNALDDLQDIL